MAWFFLYIPHMRCGSAWLSFLKALCHREGAVDQRRIGGKGWKVMRSLSLLDTEIVGG